MNEYITVLLLIPVCFLRTRGLVSRPCRDVVLTSATSMNYASGLGCVWRALVLVTTPCVLFVVASRVDTRPPP